MSYCIKCGTKISDNDKYCFNCGTKTVYSAESQEKQELKYSTLINCKECGREISSQAINCPHCGYPMKLDDNTIIKITNELKTLFFAYFKKYVFKKACTDLVTDEIKNKFIKQVCKTQTEIDYLQSNYNQIFEETKKSHLDKKKKDTITTTILTIIFVILGLFGIPIGMSFILVIF